MSKTINDSIIDWIVKKAENGYAEDIAMILAYGSYINGTANARSDVDCYFIPKTERGYEFGADFILNDIGYDIFPMSWERVEGIADLKDVLSPCVGDVEILYCSTEADLKKFEGLQEKLRSNLKDTAYAGKIARERLAFACSLYARMKRFGRLSEIRTYGGYIIMKLADVLAVHNQDYFHYGLKKQYDDLKNFRKLPDTFLEEYLNVIKAEDGIQLKEDCSRIILSVRKFLGLEPEEADCGGMEEEQLERGKKQPDFQGLAGLYEEISSTFNKIYICCEDGNAILAFLSAVCLQNELNELYVEYDMNGYDILSSYHYDNLKPLSEKTKKVEDEFVRLITKGGGTIKKFADFEAFERAGL